MSYLFEHHLHFQGINIFVLARDEHGRHANNVQIADLTSLCLALEVAVKQGDGQEESLVVALKVREHLDHPVNHACPQRRSDLVLDQAILSETLQLKLSRVCHNLVTILVIHINILPLNFVGSLTAEMCTGMHLCEVGQDIIGVDHVTLTDANIGCRLEGRLAHVALSLVGGSHRLVQLEGSGTRSDQSLTCIAIFLFHHLVFSSSVTCRRI